MNLLMTLAAVTLASASSPVTGLSVHSASTATEIIVAVDGAVQVRDFSMEGPDRLVIDVMGAEHSLPAANFPEVNRGGIRSIRTSQYAEDVVRIVLELERPVTYDLEQVSGAIRIVFENPSGPFESWRSVLDETTPVESAEPEAAPESVPAPVAEAAPGFVEPQVQETRRPITVTFSNTPIRDVLFTFAEFANRSIVPGSEVQGLISAEIRNQPWDQALQVLLEAQGLVAREMENGIIRVDNIQNLFDQEAVIPLVTRPFRVNYAAADELREPIEALLSERGSVSVGEGTNTLVVTDIPRVLEAVGQLIEELDVRTPQVNISAKIIFVNRTDLDEFGVTYDLKDSQGNQLNTLTPGAVDEDGNGVIDLPDEQVDRGTDVISLGGNSVAALGNATNRVAGPTLSLLTSLVMGRYTLLNFIEALESVNLSDIQAAPSVTVLDNRTARILVGERTPVRVIDAGASAVGGGGGGGQGGGNQSALPTATVDFQETGIILQVTPHVTAGDNILLELEAERSSADVADSDVGLIFRTQEAESRVLVQDGETVVIGGLTVTETSEVRSGIPLLMNMPVIGGLFRTTRESRVQRDLMILVTPNIVRSQGN